MMRYWKAGLFFLIAFIVQPTVLNTISIKGYTPNLLLCLVILFSFLYEDKIYGIVYGTAFGILYDVIYSSVIGPTVISFVIIAIIIMFVRTFVNVEMLVNMWAVSICSILLYYCMNWGLYHIAGNPIGFHIAMELVPWVGIYSLVVLTILYLILRRFKIKERKAVQGYRYR